MLVCRQKMLLFVVISLFFLFLDRLVKYLAVTYLNQGSYGLFRLYINKGIIFSLPLPVWLIVTVTLLIIVFIIIFIVKRMSTGLNIYILPALFIVLGASSNLVDRMIYGGVIDMIDFNTLLIFNLADVMIIFGVSLTLYMSNLTPKNCLSDNSRVVPRVDNK